MENTTVENNVIDTADTTADNASQQPENEKTYTEKEIQSLIDAKVTQALKTANRKSEAKIAEAQKLASMDADEKYKYQLEQREKAIEEKEKALALADNKNTCIGILADKGIPVQLADFVVAEDADEMKSKIGTLDKYFKLAVKAEVEKRLAGTNPKKNLPLDKALDKDGFNKLSLMKQQELFNTNPELYKQLTT